MDPKKTTKINGKQVDPMLESVASVLKEFGSMLKKEYFKVEKV